MKIGKIIAILLGIAFGLLFIFNIIHEFAQTEPTYRQEDIDAAYEQGYDEGYDFAKDEYGVAYGDGYDDGYRDGFDEGVEAGYGDGYEDAKNGW